jgi:prepilin signal peptidase PulO-like enzyme (type II secretory pathway)
MLRKLKSNMTIPFGPLLISSTFICFFFGSQIINWYMRLIG